jgi:hypothetical protein
MIEGKLYNFGGHDFFSAMLRPAGSVSATMPVIVQSFRNPGFSGEPDAQVTIPAAAWTNTQYRLEAPFVLKGLHAGTHYIRAFVDSNGNGRLDDWETWGFGRDLQTYYEPVNLVLEGAGPKRISDQTIIVRDRDTDNDDLPDIWEYANYGTPDSDAFLDINGSDTLGGNNLPLSTRWQYGLDAFTNVGIVDRNGNGIPDEWEMYYFGRLLNAGEPLTDPDGDGMSISAEYRAGTDPTNPGDALKIDRMIFGGGAPEMIWSGTQNYRIFRTDSLKGVWVRDDNLANYQRISLGGGAFTWIYHDPLPPASGQRFYRVGIVSNADPLPPITP